MKLFQSFVIFIFIFCADKVSTANSTCGDWEPYKDERCYKILESAGLVTHENAEKVCQQSAAQLISVHSAEEQTFLNKYIFEQNKIVDNVWTSAQNGASNQFKWADSTPSPLLTFTNWMTGSPKTMPNYCVEMRSDVDSVGKWADEPCTKKNVVVCQKKPALALDQLQEIVFELRTQLAQLEANPLPIGYIYAQLPKQKSPQEIWPRMTWKDISSTYGGVFFRVLGEGSSDFGYVQEGSSPRLEHISLMHGFESETSIDVTPGTLSKAIYSGSALGNSYGLKFQVSDHEVRPRNMAIRIWERIA